MTAADPRVPPDLGRVLDANGQSAGTCFQIVPGLYVTAWHVLDVVGAGRPGDRVVFESLRGGDAADGTTRLCGPDTDLAVFGSTHALPASADRIAASDDVAPLTPVVVTGAVEIYDTHHTYHHHDAPGWWQGGSARDHLLLARVKSDAVVPGISGAPVRRLSDGAVLGVVSGRYNSADGWLEHSVWVARTEYLAELLAELHPITLVGAEESARPAQAPPAVWNLGPRNQAFVGREHYLMRVRDHVRAGRATVIEAFHGMGGVGKTQLVLEYAHRYRDEYDLAWWIQAEQPALVGEQVAELAKEAGWVSAQADTATAVKAARLGLRRSRRWLVVFDNAEDPEDMRSWLPDGPGHVLITTRNPNWTELASPVRLDVMPRAESIALLRSYQPALPAADALAERLGDLPLALAQAGGFLSATGSSVREYLDLLGGEAGRLLDEGRPTSYPVSLAAAIELSLNRLLSDDPAAVGIMRVCAFLAPVPIPSRVFISQPAELPSGGNELEAIKALRGQVLQVRLSIQRLIGYGLAAPQETQLLVHRLTQAVVRDRLAPEEARAYRDYAEALVAGVQFDDPNDASTWLDWDHLLPHVLAVDPAETTNADLRYLAGNAAWYLIARGDPQGALRLAGNLYRRWRDRLGADNENALAAAHVVAQAYAETGRPAEARKLNEDIYRRRQRTLGVDHFDTLDSAGNLAMNLRDLGLLHEARDMLEDTLERRVRVLGPSAPRTLLNKSNLADVLARLGELGRSREIAEEVYAHERRVLGADHPYTLYAAHKLAWIRGLADDRAGALALNEETLERRCAVLGNDHPDTLLSLEAVTAELLSRGEREKAESLRRRMTQRQPGDPCGPEGDG